MCVPTIHLSSCSQGLKLLNHIEDKLSPHFSRREVVVTQLPLQMQIGMLAKVMMNALDATKDIPSHEANQILDALGQCME